MALARPGVGRGQKMILPGRQKIRIQLGARGDHLDHLPPDQPLGLLGILDLLANCHRKALLGQAGDVTGRGVVGHPAHGDRLSPILPPGGQGNVQGGGGHLGVLEEHFVEIAHAVEQQAVRVAFLLLQVLPDHGGLIGGYDKNPFASRP